MLDIFFFCLCVFHSSTVHISAPLNTLGTAASTEKHSVCSLQSTVNHSSCMQNQFYAPLEIVILIQLNADKICRKICNFFFFSIRLWNSVLQCNTSGLKSLWNLYLHFTRIFLTEANLRLGCHFSLNNPDCWNPWPSLMFLVTEGLLHSWP